MENTMTLQNPYIKMYQNMKPYDTKQNDMSWKTP